MKALILIAATMFSLNVFAAPHDMPSGRPEDANIDRSNPDDMKKRDDLRVEALDANAVQLDQAAVSHMQAQADKVRELENNNQLNQDCDVTCHQGLGILEKIPYQQKMVNSSAKALQNVQAILARIVNIMQTGAKSIRSALQQALDEKGLSLTEMNGSCGA